MNDCDYSRFGIKLSPAGLEFNSGISSWKDVAGIKLISKQFEREEFSAASPNYVLLPLIAVGSWGAIFISSSWPVIAKLLLLWFAVCSSIGLVALIYVHRRVIAFNRRRETYQALELHFHSKRESEVIDIKNEVLRAYRDSHPIRGLLSKATAEGSSWIVAAEPQDVQEIVAQNDIEAKKVFECAKNFINRQTG